MPLLQPRRERRAALLHLASRDSDVESVECAFGMNASQNEMTRSATLCAKAMGTAAASALSSNACGAASDASPAGAPAVGALPSAQALDEPPNASPAPATSLLPGGIDPCALRSGAAAAGDAGAGGATPSPSKGRRGSVAISTGHVCYYCASLEPPLLGNHRLIECPRRLRDLVRDFSESAHTELTLTLLDKRDDLQKVCTRTYNDCLLHKSR